MEVVEEAPDQGCEVHQSRVADRPVVGLKLLHRNNHRLRDVGGHIVSQEGIIEDRLHYVEAVNLVVICLICYFKLCQQEIQCAVQEQCFLSLNLGLSSDLIVRAIGFDNGWLSSQNRQDCRWDASRATQNCAVVLREDPLQRLFEHLHGDMLVRFRDKKLFDEESEGLRSDRDRAPVLRLEEHLKEAVAQESHVLIDEELALVGWITW